jgi:hypothetical protein
MMNSLPKRNPLASRPRNDLSRHSAFSVALPICITSRHVTSITLEQRSPAKPAPSDHARPSRPSALITEYPSISDPTTAPKPSLVCIGLCASVSRARPVEQVNRGRTIRWLTRFENRLDGDTLTESPPPTPNQAGRAAATRLQPGYLSRVIRVIRGFSQVRVGWGARY